MSITQWKEKHEELMGLIKQKETIEHKIYTLTNELQTILEEARKNLQATVTGHTGD